MKKVITPVGTSLFSNYMKNSDMITTDYETIDQEPDSSWKEYKKDDEEIEAIREAVTPWAKNNETASAEIKSLVKILKNERCDLDVYLMATATIVSRLAAEILVDVLDGFKNKEGNTLTLHFNLKQDVIQGLQVENQTDFEKEGISGLVNRVFDIASGYFGNVILNITGGYKATIPYLTIMGQINNMPLHYIFEDTDGLITIPQAPVDINWEMFGRYSHLFRQLDMGVEQSWKKFKKENNLQYNFDACVYETVVDERPLIGLNAIGEMFWNRYQNFFWFICHQEAIILVKMLPKRES